MSPIGQTGLTGVIGATGATGPAYIDGAIPSAFSITSGAGLNTTSVYGSGRTVVAGSSTGAAVSTNFGVNWTPINQSQGQLSSDNVKAVFLYGPSIYVATARGLSISDNGGTSWSTADVIGGSGIASDNVKGVWSGGNNGGQASSPVYAATDAGLSYSDDAGVNFFTPITTGQGLGSNTVNGVFATPTTVYVATANGVAYGTLGGSSVTNVTAGLGSATVNGVFASGSMVYAATAGGLSISADSGVTYTNYTTANGLGSNTVNAVWASGSTIYAATAGGLSISSNGGTSFINYASAVPGTTTSGVWGDPNNVYVTGTSGGRVSIGR